MDKLNKAENIDIVKVPYRGGGEVVNAVLGGTTPIAVLALSNMGGAASERPDHAAGSGGENALAAVSRGADARTGAPRRGFRDDLVRPVHAKRGAAGRSSRRSRATPIASWPSRRSASGCTPTAPSSPQASGSTSSPATSARSASSPSRSSGKSGVEPK